MVIQKPIKQKLEGLGSKASSWLKQQDPAVLQDAILNLGLAALSFRAFGTTETKTTETYISGYTYSSQPPYSTPTVPGHPQPTTPLRKIPIYSTREAIKKTYHPESLMIGPIGLKLAQTDGMWSQVAGLTTLGILGLLSSRLGNNIPTATVDIAGQSIPIKLPVPPRFP